MSQVGRVNKTIGKSYLPDREERNSPSWSWESFFDDDIELPILLDLKQLDGQADDWEVQCGRIRERNESSHKQSEPYIAPIAACNIIVGT